MKDLTLKDIVRQQLETGGFDGLWNGDAECACLKDDLFPCDSPSPFCQPGYKGPCDCGEHDWHVGRTRG